MIVNFGNMGQVIICDGCGDQIKVKVWYEIKQAMIDCDWVQIGRGKKRKEYCWKCRRGV